MDFIDRVIEREGGFVDHPLDKGGPTKYGITVGTLSRHLGRQVSAAAVYALTKQTAKVIYQQHYLIGPRIAETADVDLREQVLDAAVLSGPRQAVKWLQRAARVHEDGIIGTETLAAVNQKGHVAHLGLRFAVFRVRGLARIVQRDSLQATFIAGWIVRATEFLLVPKEPLDDN